MLTENSANKPMSITDFDSYWAAFWQKIPTVIRGEPTDYLKYEQLFYYLCFVSLCSDSLGYGTDQSLWCMAGKITSVPAIVDVEFGIRDLPLEYQQLYAEYLKNSHMIRTDIYEILSHAHAEVPGVIALLEGGFIDGQLYEGTGTYEHAYGSCHCLVGSIADIRGGFGHGRYYDIWTALPGIKPRERRPAERWFRGIRPGMKPATHMTSWITALWIREYAVMHGIEVKTVPIISENLTSSCPPDDYTEDMGA